MEDALISPIGLQILTGAGLIEADENKSIKVHVTETTDAFIVPDDYATNKDASVTVLLTKKPYVPEKYRVLTTTTDPAGYKFDTNNISAARLDEIYRKEDFIYVMPMRNGEILSEPFIPSEGGSYTESSSYQQNTGVSKETKLDSELVYEIKIPAAYNDLKEFAKADAVLVDYYEEYFNGTWQIDIEPQMFGGNFYVEAETLFRDTNGVDSPAEFIIPNCKVQSNFTFSMAASGDPSEEKRLAA